MLEIYESAMLYMLCVSGFKVLCDSGGFLCTEEGQGDSDKLVFGSYKAEQLLYFTGWSMALAGWADLEALMDFYEAMLEVRELAEGIYGDLWG